MKNLSSILKSLLVTIVFGAIYFYLVLPAVNFQNEGFYVFLILLVAVFCIAYLILSYGPKQIGVIVNDQTYKRLPIIKPALVVVGAIVVVFIVGYVISMPIFRAGSYTDLIQVQEGNFTDDVAEISFNQIPLLDKQSAQKLGDRKLGELSDMVSQFEVSDEYAQINFNNRPHRVTPLNYGDIFKWFNNTKKGLPAYMRLDMITQEVEVVRLDNGMQYSPAEHFNKLLTRHLRFNYPTYMFGTATFEINDDGHPYWISPHIAKTIGLFGGTDVKGIVLVDAVTGECKYYAVKDIPNWIDCVFPADLIIQQYDYHGQYVKGFINSIFGQKEVTQTTEGYNYLAINDDIYIYTGITSSGNDESNIGFILTNQRTKDTKYYSVPGAAEVSAMRSAEGVVQHLNYKATFPLLLNIAKQPTYFIALKDNAQLVKQYAMVNVERYQIVATGSSVAECEKNYIQLLSQSGGDIESSGKSIEATGTITDIRTAVREGNTFFYFKLDSADHYFSTSATQNEFVVTLNKGDKLKVTYWPGVSSIVSIEKIELITDNTATTPPATQS